LPPVELGPLVLETEGGHRGRRGLPATEPRRVSGLQCKGRRLYRDHGGGVGLSRGWSASQAVAVAMPSRGRE
jgi:hypothetical protein